MKIQVFALIMVLFSTLTFASESYPPVGPSILSEAGHCPVGPFGRDGNVGVYQGYCNDLEPKEVCTAYLVGIVNNDIEKVDPAKVLLCKSVLVR